MLFSLKSFLGIQREEQSWFGKLTGQKPKPTWYDKMIGNRLEDMQFNYFGQ